MGLVVFDFDNTLIKGDCTSAILQKAYVDAQLVAKIYLMGFRIARKLRFISVNRYKTLAFKTSFKTEEDYKNYFNLSVTWNTQAVACLRNALENDDSQVVISSASEESLVKCLLSATEFDISQVVVHASNVRIDEDYFYWNYGHRKVKHIRETAGMNLPIDITYTDHVIADKALIHESDRVVLVSPSIVKGLVNSLLALLYQKFSLL